MAEAQRILVIEDEPILRTLLADWLLAAGYRVGLAANGRAGIEDARAHPPALVVTDIHMPGMGGEAVIPEVRRIYPGLPVIAISAHFGSTHGLSPHQAIALGAARTLTKPFRRKDMLGAVCDLVGPPAV
jgi:CheY-like chemotaxis protein